MTATAALKNFTWQQTMLRIKDPKVTVPFYQNNFGMTLIHEYHFPQYKFSLYFLQKLKDSEKLDFEVPSLESEKYLWNLETVALELTHNWGSETDDSFSVNNGNIEPHRGFGHIAFNVDDVEAYTQKLLANNVQFKKLPWEGTMKTIAFAYDPDKYWIEIVPRLPGLTYPAKENFSQTMIRVKDPQKALDFYCGKLGLHLLRANHHSDFSLYFLANPILPSHTPLSEAEGHIEGLGDQLPNYYPLSEGDNLTKATSVEGRQLVSALWRPVLELTHNHGTESNPEFAYHNGNDAPQGFGHIGFLTDDLTAAVQELDRQNTDFRKRPETGMRGLAFILDDNKYSSEIIQKGISFGEESFVRPEQYKW